MVRESILLLGEAKKTNSENKMKMGDNPTTSFFPSPFFKFRNIKSEKEQYSIIVNRLSKIYR
jgi:hypothetical protein